MDATLKRTALTGLGSLDSADPASAAPATKNTTSAAANAMDSSLDDLPKCIAAQSSDIHTCMAIPGLTDIREPTAAQGAGAGAAFGRPSGTGF
jgi:hypothetical protein